MTKAPDRIWARLDDPQVEPGETTGKWVDHGPGEPEEKPYLLSTPAREAAEELLEALEEVLGEVENVEGYSYQRQKLTERTRAVIAKAKGEG